mmetsp:Transcript_39975/g.119060  ORF Transcript_39975/g.119060 Transcript_39975/m.119060 type:complete len:305 (-) Transcript_39975:471-1385(-)
MCTSWLLPSPSEPSSPPASPPPASPPWASSPPSSSAWLCTDSHSPEPEELPSPLSLLSCGCRPCGGMCACGSVQSGGPSSSSPGGGSLSTTSATLHAGTAVAMAAASCRACVRGRLSMLRLRSRVSWLSGRRSASGAQSMPKEFHTSRCSSAVSTARSATSALPSTPGGSPPSAKHTSSDRRLVDARRDVSGVVRDCAPAAAASAGGRPAPMPQAPRPKRLVLYSTVSALREGSMAANSSGLRPSLSSDRQASSAYRLRLCRPRSRATAAAPPPYTRAFWIDRLANERGRRSKWTRNGMSWCAW